MLQVAALGRRRSSDWLVGEEGDRRRALARSARTCGACQRLDGQHDVGVLEGVGVDDALPPRRTRRRRTARAAPASGLDRDVVPDRGQLATRARAPSRPAPRRRGSPSRLRPTRAEPKAKHGMRHHRGAVSRKQLSVDEADGSQHAFRACLCRDLRRSRDRWPGCYRGIERRWWSTMTVRVLCGV